MKSSVTCEIDNSFTRNFLLSMRSRSISMGPSYSPVRTVKDGGVSIARRSPSMRKEDVPEHLQLLWRVLRLQLRSYAEQYRCAPKGNQAPLQTAKGIWRRLKLLRTSLPLWSDSECRRIRF